MSLVQLHLPPSSLGQTDLDGLSLPALLWGYRHRLWGFESLVHYAERNYSRHGELLIALASLEKNQYSETGSEVLKNLHHTCVTDTTDAHQQAANEVFHLLFQRLYDEASPQLLYSVFSTLSSELLFCHEEDWSGYDATAPYLHDRGPRQELISFIVRFKARLDKEGVTTEAWESLAYLINKS